jgi:hypothetical protein
MCGKANREGNSATGGGNSHINKLGIYWQRAENALSYYICCMANPKPLPNPPWELHPPTE